MKYAEVTVIKNASNRGVGYSFGVFTGLVDEERVIDKDLDQVIMTFEDDETPFDTKDRYVDCKYKFDCSCSLGPVEFNWIYSPNKEYTLFKREPKEVDGKLKLCFKEFVDNHPKNKNIKTIPSYYSFILYHHTVVGYKSVDLNVFCIVRMESASSKPRYLVAYDETLFTKEKVVYLVRQLLLRLYEETSLNS